MKECPELLTQDEYNEICMEMLAFQERNNRLSYTEGNQGRADTVEDKSFELSESSDAVEEEVAIDPATVPKQESGLIDSVRNLFRS